MKRLAVVMLLLVLALVAIAPAGAAPPTTVKAGVSAAGVDLSGLTLDQAAAKLNAELLPRLAGDLVITVGSNTRTFTMGQGRISLDTTLTAKRALYAKTGTAVAPKITHSRLATDLLVRQISRDTRVDPRNAKVEIGTRRIRRTPGRSGQGIDVRAARVAIDRAIDDPAAPRALTFKLVRLPPQITAAELRAQYDTVITVDRASFTLRLFKGYKLRKSYRVAVGQPAYPTPPGRYNVSNKQVNPIWSVPNSPWAGELAGTVVDGGTDANPLKARWMGLANGIGIHGTGEEWSIGSRASHGCIRMRVVDVIDLYPRVPLGTTVIVR